MGAMLRVQRPFCMDRRQPVKLRNRRGRSRPYPAGGCRLAPWDLGLRLSEPIFAAGDVTMVSTDVPAS